MIHIKKILHPTDFSNNSQHALKYACAFASHFGSELHLVHVIADLGMVTLPPVDGYLPASYYEEARKRANEELEKLPGSYLSTEIKVVKKAMEGTVFPEIIQYAQDENIDLLVVGTHGYTGLSHLLLGSVAEKIVRRSPCPVLTVSPEDHEFIMP